MSADAIGFVFAPAPGRLQPRPSVTSRSDSRTGLSLSACSATSIPTSCEDVLAAGLHGAQLHGREPFSEVASVRSRLRS